MSSCEDMLYPNLDYHCKGFGAADTKDEISVKSRNSWLCLAIQTMTHVQTSCLSPKQFTHFFIFNYYYHKIPLCHSKEHCLCVTVPLGPCFVRYFVGIEGILQRS